mmetsp:Transcript_25130/g.31656  ORF Transcript_25130/g.31656 Transcript_25130/m.31656 type:complete len:250 (+) Transcript_25130:52-801(+)
MSFASIPPNTDAISESEGESESGSSGGFASARQFFYWTAKSSREWKVLVMFEVFVSVVILCASHVLKLQTTPNLPSENGDGDDKFWIPDLAFGYTSSSLHKLMGALQADGRRLYLGIEIWDSFVYSFGYTFLLASSLQWCIDMGHNSNSNSNSNSNRKSNGTSLLHIRMLAWVPWLTDLVENATHVYCIMTFVDNERPNEMWNAVANIGSHATRVKWSTFAINVLFIVIITLRKRRRSNPELLSKRKQQ